MYDEMRRIEKSGDMRIIQKRSTGEKGTEEGIEGRVGGRVEVRYVTKQKLSNQIYKFLGK